MATILHLTKTNDIVDGSFRPVASSLTIDQAAAHLASTNLPLYVEAQFRLEPLAPVSLDKQMAAKLRRLRAIAGKCGRIVSRVDERHNMPHQYVALLAR